MNIAESIIKTRAQRHGLFVRKDDHGVYLLVDKNDCTVVPAPMSFVELTLWLDGLDKNAEETK